LNRKSKAENVDESGLEALSMYRVLQVSQLASNWQSTELSSQSS
jgi:hypothetical protein